jgi:hypothetical protein
MPGFVQAMIRSLFIVQQTKATMDERLRCIPVREAVIKEKDPNVTRRERRRTRARAHRRTVIELTVRAR